MFDPDYLEYRSHPSDPRTPEDDGHQDWIDNNYTFDLIGPEATQEVLTTLMTHPELAKKKLDEYLAEAWLEKREKDAQAEYEDRRDAA